ncbi:BglG family transcription antiterminator [Streptococcus moroccensis]|uniref:Lichenan operon transcriptional antiterminator n=1 Tax=Streptococcus moroccensis TaxID=1451356 RepID=A0ABT9YRI3_9STRE|nr:BglG family transcription antiterminator [Streptococcus moroccensis]MDQ0222609.1 lichenan operon transcriptional antiterminator [Streptococcus moroccensis]
MNRNLYDLLKLLSLDSYQTSQELADKLGVSEKTVRNRMKELKDLLGSYGAEIESKRHFGYKLIIFDEKVFLKVSPKDDSEIPETSEDRQNVLLKWLLDTDDFLKIDDIAEQFFISRNTLSATLKRVEAILTMYNLRIERKPNYGFRVIGKEFYKRICLLNTLYEEFMDTSQDQWLMETIIEGNQRHKVNMSEVALENVVKYISITIKRLQDGHAILEKDVPEELMSSATQQIVDDYSDLFEQQFGQPLSLPERQFLAIHYGSRLSSDSYSHYGPNFVITGEIDELVYKMLTRVHETLALDFRQNLELRMALNQHLVPMDIRMRFNIAIQNPLLDLIKQEYPYPFTIALNASTSLKEHYGKDIPEDEVAYIAIIFALATEKRNRSIERKNIVLVCISGKSSSQLFKFKYRQAFGDYLNNIYECTVADLEQFDFKGKEIDYIFTTVPLNQKYPVPIYEINLFIDANEILTYRQMFESGDRSTVLNYYSTNLFLPKLTASTREEVIAHMCQHIDHYGLLPEGFEEAVLRREELGQTDFGNLVALPHPYQVMTEQSFVTVAILEEPILWKTNKVQVVFLLSIGSQEDPQLEDFYQKTSNLFFDEKAIQNLITTPTFETLVHILS